MKLVPLLMVLVGALLIYSAKVEKDPRNVVFESLGIKMRVDNPSARSAGEATGKALEDLGRAVTPTYDPDAGQGHVSV